VRTTVLWVDEIRAYGTLFRFGHAVFLYQASMIHSNQSDSRPTNVFREFRAKKTSANVCKTAIHIFDARLGSFADININKGSKDHQQDEGLLTLLIPDFIFMIECILP
jgi:hypothetical protein